MGGLWLCNVEQYSVFLSAEVHTIHACMVYRKDFIALYVAMILLYRWLS